MSRRLTLVDEQQKLIPQRTRLFKDTYCSNAGSTHFKLTVTQFLDRSKSQNVFIRIKDKSHFISLFYKEISKSPSSSNISFYIISNTNSAWAFTDPPTLYFLSASVQVIEMSIFE